jgi:tetraacyldisaccharide 4'-kinase
MRAPEFWRRRGGLSACLVPVSWLVTAAGRLRRIAVTPAPAPVPVICIGNITVGGAGKTPVAIAVEARLRARSRSAHFLTRGYGGHLRGPVRVEPKIHAARDVGDEPLILARHAPCWVSADRPLGAKAAATNGAEVIIMDDGFQNPSLEKSLSLVVIDGAYGFGNGRVIPAGPLREPMAGGLDRADGVIVVGPMAETVATERPIMRAHLQAIDNNAVAGRPVVAFAGIGRPEKFFETLGAMGCDVIARYSFSDHHPYAARDLEPILERAASLGVTVVTTEKDAVRVPSRFRSEIVTLKVEIVWDDVRQIDALLERLF